jgi:hypothetical protein
MVDHGAEAKRDGGGCDADDAADDLSAAADGRAGNVLHHAGANGLADAEMAGVEAGVETDGEDGAGGDGALSGQGEGQKQKESKTEKLHGEGTSRLNDFRRVVRGTGNRERRTEHRAPGIVPPGLSKICLICSQR